MKFKVFFFLLIPSFLIAQEQTSIETSYKKYFELPRESVFIHTNKTTYLAGEKIWLKTYILDRKNGLSSKASSNIHVDLFDNKGNVVRKNLVLNNKGIGKGQIEIDTTFHSGIYYLKASTNWMKNFKEDDTYIQKIEIINPKKWKAQPDEKESYDIQLLPEGGNILANAFNSIGVKAIDNYGKGVACKGIIENSKGETIASVKTNSLGMGKFSFTPKKGESYTAKFTIGTLVKINKAIPKISEKGISIKVDNYRIENIIINFSTNKETLAQGFTNYDLVIHKDGQLSSIPITINKTASKVALPKKLLFSGVNTITLFNKDKKPVLQRMFFNDYGFKIHTMNAVNIKIDGDSTNYSMVSRSLAPNEILKASISVLPTGTKSYNQEHNIVSAFHLKPYLSGVIEKPSYYFKEFNSKKKYELDLLLLTQGWTRYSWNDVFNNTPNPKFDFENGITFNGKLYSALDNVTSLIMHPTEKNKSLFLVYDGKGKFHLKNFYPYINEEVYFTYFDKRGNMKKPILSFSPIERNSSKQLILDEKTKKYSSLIENTARINIAVEKDYELLDEVKLKAKVDRDEILVNARVTTIGEEEIRNYPVITDFIQNSGFNVQFGDGALTQIGQVYIYSRRQSTLSAPKSNISNLRGIRGQPGNAFGTDDPSGNEQPKKEQNDLPNLPSPTIFVDGAQLADFSMLYNMPTKSIEKIVVDKSGVGAGINGFGGVIRITTRKGPIPNRKASNYSNSFTYLVKYGFLKPEKFYNPKYVFRNDRAFKRYGVVFWSNDVQISNDSSYQMKVNNTLFDSLDFYIEGFTNLGNFISRKIKIKKVLD